MSFVEAAQPVASTEDSVILPLVTIESKPFIRTLAFCARASVLAVGRPVSNPDVNVME